MENIEKVRYISKQEASDIDAKKIAYLTLNDGTVLILKSDSEPDLQQENEIIEEEEQNQEQEKERIISSIQDTDQIHSNHNINEEDIHQQISSVGYNLSSEEEKTQKISDNNNIVCNCNINNQIINNYIGGKYFVERKGIKRQLYKLVEAIPVRFCDIEGVQLINQNTNLQLNLRQYNNDTYVIERSNRDTSSNYQINTQSSGNEYIDKKIEISGNNIEQKCTCCNCGIDKEKFNKMHYVRERESQQEEDNCYCREGEGEFKCCCPIGNPEMRKVMEIVSPEIAEQFTINENEEDQK